MVYKCMDLMLVEEWTVSLIRLLHAQRVWVHENMEEVFKGENPTDLQGLNICKEVKLYVHLFFRECANTRSKEFIRRSTLDSKHTQI